MLKNVLLATAIVFGLATSASAGVVGSVAGPDGGFSINFSFTNTGPQDITSLSIDGSTTALNLVWDGVPSTSGTNSAPTSGTLSNSNHLLTYLWGAGGFVSGNILSFNIDPDTPGNSGFGAIVSDLLSVSVSVLFGNGSVFSGKFVDDPAEGAGLMLVENVAEVPIPAALPLLATAFAGLGLAGFRRKAKGTAAAA